jgi:D-3-phosphoglycerate dehydrogenase
MIGRAELEAMKPTAFFINTSRGGTYDEDALAQALREQRIAGAGIDVFLREPPPKDHPLLQFDNVIATPHIAGMTHESTRKMATYAAEQWLDIFDGKRPPRLVNPEAWPLYCERFERIMGARPRDDAA